MPDVPPRSFISRLRRASLAVVAALALAVTPVLAAPALADPVESSITGVVSADAGGAAPSVLVTVTGLTPESTPSGSTYTDVLGQFTVTPLVPGSYRVQFSAPGWVSEYYLDAYDEGSATPVAVIDHEPVTINASIAADGPGPAPRTSSLSGTVTGQGVGALAGVNVQLSALDYSFTASQLTDAGGHYTIPDMPAGTFRVAFVGPGAAWLPQWYGGSMNIGDAVAIPVAEGQAVTGIDAQLAPDPNAPPPPTTAQVSGTVYDQNGVPINDAMVAVCPHVGVAGDTCFYARTIADGTYTVTGITPRTYVIGFYAAEYLSQFYPGVASFEDATPLTVAAGNSFSGYDANLAVDPGPPVYDPSSLSGTVSSAGDPVSGVTVEAYYTTGALAASTTTNAAGLYQFTDLGGFFYTLRFVPADGSLGTEWWQDEPRRSVADYFKLEWGENRTGVDAVLGAPVYSSISGAVTDSRTGLPLAGVTVQAYDSTSGESVSASTNGSGAYFLEGVAAGTYQLGFFAPSSHHLNEWWNDASQVADADPLTVGIGQTLSGLDAALVPAGYISGTVVDTAGDPVIEAVVGLYTLSGDLVDEQIVDGEYNFYIAAGDYQLRFSAADFETEWWDDASTQAGAETVTLTDGTVSVDQVVLKRVGELDPPVGTPTEDSGILIPLVDQNGDYPAQIVFEDITAPGVTYVTTTSTGPTPTGFRLLAGAAAVFYDISTTTEFTGSVYLCFSFDTSALTQAEIDAVSVYHFAGGGWTDITVDELEPGVICGVTDSFSPFALGLPLANFTTSSVPTISGTKTVGAILTANRRTWDPVLAPADFGYQWNRDGVAIPGATATAYTLAPDDAGTKITVTVTATKSGYYTLTQTSAETGYITGGVWSVIGETTISGTPAVGQYLFADAATSAPAATTLRYQWFRTVDSTTTGLSSSNRYTVRAADAGHAVYAIVTASKPGFPNTTAQSDPKTIEKVLISAKPTITGSPLAVGSTLTAVPGTWGPEGVALAYTWLRDGRPIGAYGDTYVLTTEDAGELISVRIDGTLPGYTTATKFSSAKTILKQLAPQPVPVISGTPVVGQTLTVDAGEWGPGTVTLKYQWYRNGTSVGGSRTVSTYTVTTADAGAELTVRVTGTQATYSPATSDPSAPFTIEGRITVSGTPSIPGSKLLVGQTVTVNPGTWSPAPVDLAFQWYFDGSPIPGATGQTYTVGTEYGGTNLTVRIVASKAGFTTETRLTAAKPVEPRVQAPAAVPTISGSAIIGDTLTAQTDPWGAEVTVSYQWKRGTTNVGTNSPTYVVATGDAGANISVVVSGTRTGHTKVSLTSAATDKVLAVKVPTISGSVLDPGGVLTAVPGAWSAGTQFSYDWKRDGLSVGTAPTYTLTTADSGHGITVAVTGSQAGFVSASRTSASKPINSLFAAAPVPTLSAGSAVGVKLTPTTTGWDPAPTFTYSWRWENGTVIGTGSTYTIKTADRGHTITLVLTGKRSLYTPATVSSAGRVIP